MVGYRHSQLHHDGVKSGKGSDMCRLGYGDIVSFTEGFPGCVQIAMSEAIEKHSNAGFS